MDRTAAEVWKSLTDIQDLATGMGLLTANNHLHTIFHVDGADLGTHIMAMREAWAKTKAQGGKLLMRTLGLSSLPLCPGNGTYILAHSMLLKHQLKLYPNSMLTMPYLHMTINPLLYKHSRHWLPCKIHVQTLYV